MVTPQPFFHCSAIRSATFEGPSSIESFCVRSFKECASLGEISIPGSVEISFERGASFEVDLPTSAQKTNQ
jgi:hypothetical protein